MGTRKEINTILRKSASAALFPILHDLEIQAALTHDAALALHSNTARAVNEIKVVVNHEDRITLEGLCAAVVSRASASANGYFKIIRKKLDQLNFISADPQARGKICRVVFIQSGGSFPTILKDFSEIVYISGVPVLPVHAILLEQLVTHSRLPVANRLDNQVVKFMSQCLVACGPTPLQQLSPLWRSPDVLHQILQHVQVLPDAQKHWIACGIDPSIFPSTTPWDIPDEAGKDVDSDDGDSDLDASEDPSTVVQALNVAPEHYDWHGQMTDAAARHVVAILTKEFGIGCAVVGSAASQLYSHGETRAPEQLDILVLQGHVSLTPSLLKRSLFQRDPVQFEWKNEILHFSDFPCPSLRCQCEQKCKVEILLPGTTGLPNLTSSDVIWINMLPVVPFLTLLLSTLQAWETDYSPAKARDVVDLLRLVQKLPVSVFRPWMERKCMSSKFQQESEARVKRFCSRSHFPEAKPTWEIFGFDVEQD